MSIFGIAPFTPGHRTNGISVSPRSAPPPALYPASLATNARLMVAVDRLQIALALALPSSALQMSVSDSSLIVPNVLLSIDNEIVQVTSVTGTLIGITRGFDGTLAAAHAAGATVSGLVDAWHHNALASEVEAIEQALGVDLTNVNSTAIVSGRYIFPPQTPGGSLIVGSNVITMSPMPVGVNGSDSGHYLYVSGGTGTAEPCLIVGGSGLAGQASGQIIIQCANTHTGAWTIQSATAGINEMIQANGAGTSMLISLGTSTVYAPINFSGLNGITLRGFGQGSTVVNLAHPTNDFLTYGVQTDNVTISDFTITSSGPRTGGWVIHGTAPYNQSALLRWSVIANITVRNQTNGFWLSQYAGVFVNNIVMENFQTNPNGIGLKIGQTAATDVNQGSEMHITNAQIYGNAPGGLTPALGYGIWMEDCDAVFLGPGVGIGLVTQGCLHMMAGGHGLLNHFFNGLVCDGGPCAQGAGTLITGTGTISDTMIDNSWFCSSGGTTTLNAAGIKIVCGAIGRLDIRDSRFENNQGPGIYISGPTNTGGGPINIQGNTFTGNGAGNQTGYLDDVYLDFPFDQNAPFVAGNVHTGSPHGFSIRTSGNTNLLTLGNNHWQNGFSFGVPPKSGLTLPVTPTSVEVGGSAMGAGTTSPIVNTTITGARPGMSVTVTPGTNMGGAFVPIAWVSANDTVSFQLISINAATPNLQNYYLRVAN
jgi:hypothetical protein